MMTAEEVERTDREQSYTLRDPNGVKRAEDIARACVSAIEGGRKFVVLVVEGAAPRGRKIRIERGTRAKCPMGEVVSFTASGTVAHFDAIEVLAWLAARGLVEVREGGKRWEVR